MTRYVALIAVAGMLAASSWAADPPTDRELIERAARPRATTAPPAAAAPADAQTADDELSAEERAARTDAILANARLELVLARKAVRAENLRTAAIKAHGVLVLLRQLPTDVDATDMELQAEGILSRAVRAGINVDALAREASEQTPMPPDDAELDRKVQAATRVGRQYSGSHRSDIDTSGDARVLRERTLRRQAGDGWAYRPGRELVDVESILAESRERLVYQGALREAYKEDEVRLLVGADEARVIPEGDVISYPSDWPERVARREKWAMGQVARSESWYDKDGREWYVAIYDIHDLIYVPPDFGLEAQFISSPFSWAAMDRYEFWRRSWGWGWGGIEEAIPLLRYFGGVNAWVDRGPKYSLERQREIVDMIKAFTGVEVEETIQIPPAPGEGPGAE